MSLALGVLLVGTVPLASIAAEDVPLPARLLAEPFESTGVRVSVSSMGDMAGLATDGELVYMLRGNVPW